MINLLPLRRHPEEWTLDLVERDGSPVATLDLIEGSGSDTYDLTRVSPHGMTCTLGSQPPTLTGRLLRATYYANGEPYLLGTWTPTACRRRAADGADDWTLTGVDPTVRFTRARLRSAYPLSVGTPIAEEVVAIAARYAPDVTLAITDTDETLRAALTWSADTPVLTVLNDLLAASGYTGLRPQLNGALTAARLAAAPGVAIEWRDDLDGAPFLPDVELDDDTLERPNEVLAIVAGTASVAGLVGRWADPLAIARDGLLSTSIKAEAATQEAADAIAAAHAATLGRPRVMDTVTGPWQPVLPGQGVRLTWAAKDIQRDALLVGKTSKWAAGGDATYNLKAVTSE